MPTINTAPLDADRVARLVEARAVAACPEGAELVRRTMDRLPPARWVLEWQLPWWVGGAMGLDAATSETLVVANVLGLVAVRLADDGRDGDLPSSDARLASLVAPALLADAVSVYRPLLPAEDPFWPWLETILARFDRASAPPFAGRITPDADPDPRRARLADRAAPVKVAPRAICALTGTMEQWPALERCLDAALEALVRYDQVMDWEADLEAGRWNAFIAALSSLPQDPAHRVANRRAVLVGALAGHALAEEFRRIRAAADEAVHGARALGLAPLAAWLADHADSTARQGGELDAHYSALATETSRRIFGALAADARPRRSARPQ